jgi:uncharacterized integral membrane protein
MVRVAIVEVQRSPASTPLPPLKSGGTNWRHWAIGTIVLLLIIFVAQNAQKVEVHFFFAKTQTPLIFALLIAVVLGVLIGWLFQRLRHSRTNEPREGTTK